MQALALADGDGEAYVQLAADGDHTIGVEAAVGPHRELSWPRRSAPPHCLTQEVGAAAGGVGPALAQPGHQHVAGSGGNGQQLAAHPVQLADMAPPEAAQEGAQGGGSFGPETENAGGPAGAQRIGVVYAVAARQRGSDQGHHLVAGVGPAGALTKSKYFWRS